MVTLMKLQGAYRKSIEAERAFEDARVAFEKLFYELPELKALQVLWEQWRQAVKELDDMWMKK